MEALQGQDFTHLEYRQALSVHGTKLLPAQD